MIEHLAAEQLEADAGRSVQRRQNDDPQKHGFRELVTDPARLSRSRPGRRLGGIAWLSHIFPSCGHGSGDQFAKHILIYAGQLANVEAGLPGFVVSELCQQRFIL
jgi:hypothetical protein